MVQVHNFARRARGTSWQDWHLSLEAMEEPDLRESGKSGSFGAARLIADTDPEPEVTMKATAGWYSAPDVIEASGTTLNLSNPKGKDWGISPCQNDFREAEDPADLLSLGRIAEA